MGVSSSVQYLWLLLVPSEHSLNFHRQGDGARVKGQRETEASGHIYLSSLRQPTASFSEQCRAMVSTRDVEEHFYFVTHADNEENREANRLITL